MEFGTKIMGKTNFCNQNWLQLQHIKAWKYAKGSPTLPKTKWRKNPPYFMSSAQLDNNALISANQVHKPVVKCFMTQTCFIKLITLGPGKIFIIKTFQKHWMSVSISAPILNWKDFEHQLWWKRIVVGLPPPYNK